MFFSSPPPPSPARLFFRVVHILARALSLGLVPPLLLANKSPTSTIAWLFTLVQFPIFGPILYFLFGSSRLARKHLRKRLELAAATGEDSATAHRDGHDAHDAPGQDPSQDEPAEPPPDVRGLRDRLDRDARVLVDVLSTINQDRTSAASSVRLLVDAERFFPALIAAIDAARHHVHFEIFIFRHDRAGEEMLAALTRTAERGIEVRLLCDPLGCTGVPTRFFRPLEEAGGQFSWFRTVAPMGRQWLYNLRNHRKVQIVDGETAFVGGMNIGLEYQGLSAVYGAWRDVQMELRGHIATTLQRTFADDWFFATEEKLLDARYYPDHAAQGTPARHLAQVMADGPDLRDDRIQMSIVALLNAARERAWLTAGYFVPNEPLLTALKICASRGVDTRLLISLKTDHPYLIKVGRSYYEELLRYGVRIFEYRSEEGVNHSKVAVFDDRWLMCGSANFDNRSMHLNFELNVLVDDPAITGEMARVLEDDYDDDSDEIELKKFLERGWREEAMESIFRPLAPLL